MSVSESFYIVCCFFSECDDQFHLPAIITISIFPLPSPHHSIFLVLFKSMPFISFSFILRDSVPVESVFHFIFHLFNLLLVLYPIRFDTKSLFLHIPSLTSQIKRMDAFYSFLLTLLIIIVVLLIVSSCFEWYWRVVTLFSWFRSYSISVDSSFIRQRVCDEWYGIRVQVS